MSFDRTAHEADVAIRVRDLHKQYLIYSRPEDRLKQMLVPRLQRLAGREPGRYYREFSALSGVSFDIRRGETVGIVGRNGSGKSTLLQMICGTLTPTSGTLEVHGRIAALLELGAGFNPEFTGRENVYLNAAILGLGRAEIDQRFDSIAAFADIGVFLDQPVKTYSSGMYLRLAFATAINVEPDIMVVDEALAVGDEAFQRKCFARLEQIQQNGATILFVSHSAQSVVQLCSRAILIDSGEMLLDGRPKFVTSQYQRLVNLRGGDAVETREEIRALNRQHTASAASGAEDESATEPAGHAAGAAPPSTVEAYDPRLVADSRVSYEPDGAIIEEIRLLTTRGEMVNIVEQGREYIYEYLVTFGADRHNVGFGMMIRTVSGFDVGGASSSLVPTQRLRFAAAGTTVRVRFKFTCDLSPGVYFINAGAIGPIDGDERFLHRVLDACIFRVAPVEDSVITGVCDLGISIHKEVVSDPVRAPSPTAA